LRGHKVIYVAINVLGNLVPEDLAAFLDLVGQSGSALVFKSRGLPADDEADSRARPVIGFDHNYPRLLARYGLDTSRIQCETMTIYSGSSLSRVEADQEGSAHVDPC